MTQPFLAVFVRLLCAFLGSAGVMAGQGTQPWNQPRFSDDVAAIYQAASSVTSTKGSEVVVLFEENTFTFDADGKCVHTKYSIYKVLSEKGAGGWDNVDVEWEPWHEEKPVLRARVIGTDQVSHPLDARTITDSPASDDDENEYGDRRVVRAPFPAIAQGAVVEEEITVRETAPLFAAGVVRRVYFGNSSPVRETRLTLDAPSSLNLKYNAQLLPQVKAERQEKNGRVVVTFDQGPMEALERGERFLPSDTPVYPQVTFSTGASWQKVAETYAHVVDQEVQRGNVADLAAQLTKGKSTPDEKLGAIIQYLAKEIRYTGVEFDESGIVPHPPAETLKKKYGDCKDKATLLVALARAAGIPAYVALLRVGSREDVQAELPGMGFFDHAIVYVAGSPAHWIDATDEYARLGQLPSSDQARLSLVAQAESTGLVRTPESTSKENRLYEKREIYLAEFGPARVVEISQPSGAFEASFRASYADAEDKDTRKGLTGYVKNEYLAEKLTKFERSDPKDLAQQFKLTLEAAPAKRGITELEDAVAAIRVESLFTSLPKELQEKASESKEKAADADETKPKPRAGDYELGEAYVADWEYTIVPPLGFRPKPLPDKKTVKLGPALFTQEFTADADGTVHGRVTFDTVKRRMSLAEAKEMSDAVAQMKQAEAIMILFEPISRTLMAEGKVRESFQATRELIAAHPKEAVHHLQMAGALLSAGMGQAAREQGRKAVALEPNSALAEKTLADILEFDLVGRKFRAGSDYAGAEKAFRAAQKLDPDDKEITANLAILLEFNSIGERYGRGAKLKEAVAEYRTLSEDKRKELGAGNNLAFALFYAGELSEARKEAESLNPQLKGLMVASEAILKGSPAGIAEARKVTSNEDEMRPIVKAAGDMAMKFRAYAVAADLEEAGASGSNSSNVMALAAMARKARKREDIVYPDDPVGLVGKMFRDAVDGKLTEERLESICSKNALIVQRRKDPEEISKTLDTSKHLPGLFLRQGLPVDAMMDIVIQALQITAEGDDKDGYRVSVRAGGDVNQKIYVVKENGYYRMLEDSEKPNAIALEILDRVQANNLAGARVLLDWVREAQHLPGGDDPLAGFAFPRMWTKGKEGDARQMKLAAAALACETKETAREGIAVLEGARKEAASDAEKLNISLGLLDGYSALRSYEQLSALATELAKEYPESKRLFLDREMALSAMSKFDESDALAQEWLRKDPADVVAMRSQVTAAVAAEKYALARERSMKIIGVNKGEANDYNNQAWYSLFTGKTDASDIEAATKGAQLSKMSPGVLHTLGCAYAEVGKTKEAREVLIQGMDALYLDEPDDNYWYAFGRIAEQYGEIQTAEADYKAVKKPLIAEAVAGSSYRLAQMRLAGLQKPSSGGAK